MEELIKTIFGDNETLTASDFIKAVTSKGYKLADLSTGSYVAKGKFDDNETSYKTQIDKLNETISERDKDLKALKKQLSDAGNDSEKLAEVTKKLETLQADYDTKQKEYENTLIAQKKEFAIKEYASSKDYTSNAAKRDFINFLSSQELQQDKMGNYMFGDFEKMYAQENPDAFTIKKTEPVTQPTQTQQPIPTFTAPTSSQSTPVGEENGFVNAFKNLGIIKS